MRVVRGHWFSIVWLSDQWRTEDRSLPVSKIVVFWRNKARWKDNINKINGQCDISWRIEFLVRDIKFLSWLNFHTFHLNMTSKNNCCGGRICILSIICTPLLDIWHHPLSLSVSVALQFDQLGFDCVRDVCL